MMRNNDKLNADAKRGELHAVPNPNRLPLCPSLVGLNDCDADYYNERPLARLSVVGHVIRGRGKAQAGANVWELSEGVTFLLPKFAHHRVFSESVEPERLVYYWINVEEDFFLEFVRRCELESGISLADVGFRPLFEQTLEHAAANRRGSEQTAAKLASLLVEIVGRLSSVASASRRPLSPLVRAAKERLLRHVGHRLKLDPLCAELGCTKRQLTYQFKRELEATPYQFLLQHKISTACQFLAQSDLTVQEIADKLAFPDMYHFSNLFKQKMGASPSQYRRSAHNQG
jgi:AraC-like DNA-binding protein